MRRFVSTLVIVTIVSSALAQDKLVEARDEGVKDFGSAVTTLPDLTDDGIPEFATGSSSEIGGGVVTIHDGKTGDRLHTIVATRPGSSFGFLVKRVGDHDADDVDDLFISAIGSGRIGSPPGYAVVISLRTLDEILYAEGRNGGGGSFGWSAANLGDVTGDDVPELIVGEPGVFGTAPGAAWVVDGKSGEIIDDMSVQDTQGTGNLGLSVCCLGDVDGDGINDWCAGAPNALSTGTTAAGKVVVFGSLAGPKIIPGGFRKITNQAGTKVKIGDFLGYNVAGADINGDRVPDLIATGLVAGGFVRAMGVTGRRKPKVLAEFSRPADATSFAQNIGVIPSVDGRPGAELLIGADNSVRVFSLATKQGLEVARVDGAPGEFIGSSFDAVSDLGSVDGPGIDFTPDILIGSSTAESVYALPLPTSVAQLPATKVKQAAFFSQDDAARGSRATGKVKATVKKGTAKVDFAFKGLPGGGPYELFVETNAGSGKFIKVGDLAGSAGKISLVGNGSLPDALGTKDYSRLGGRGIELRDGSGAVALTSVFPYSTAPKKQKSSIAFQTEQGSPYPNATFSANVSTNNASGKTTVSFRAKNIPATEPLELWGEVTPGSGQFAKIADLSKGKLRLDAKSLAAYPNIIAGDIGRLIARILQLRSATAVLATRFDPTSTDKPDFIVKRISLDYDFLQDRFAFRANVKNRGAADAGPVNLTTTVSFTLGTDTRVEVLEHRTNEDFPAGVRHTDLPLGVLDNPFPGSRPDVVVIVSADRDSTGGSGEYEEEDESNNDRTEEFEVDPNDATDYDRAPDV